MEELLTLLCTHGGGGVVEHESNSCGTAMQYKHEQDTHMLQYRPLACKVYSSASTMRTPGIAHSNEQKKVSKLTS